MTERERLGWKWWLWPLRSRKVQVAIVTVVVAWTGHVGVEISEGALLAVVAMGVALILGIAHEDAGQK